MTGVLVDSSLISELTRHAPDARVLSFLVEHDDLWLSAVGLLELKFAVELLPIGDKRDRIHSAITALTSQFEDRILPVDESVANQAAMFRVQQQRAGRKLDLNDALIAGTASVNNLSLATRNVQDFKNLDLSLINPWDST